MKLIARTRWEYYVANVAGIIAVLGLFIWFLTQSISNAGVDFRSVFFWLALVLLIAFPYALISFFSSMKTVEVTATGLIISYVFQRHKNEILFSDIAEMKSSRTEKETRVRPRSIRDTFRLILADGRAFEFDRSQFNQYGQLKSICSKRMSSKENSHRAALSRTVINKKAKR